MSNRPAMLASVVRERIAPVLRECPLECGIVSIVSVEVSADFTFATVAISALQSPELALKFLESRKRDLQANLAKLGAHRTPKLRFRIDREGQRATRVEELLEKASKENAGDTSNASQEEPREL